MTGYYAIRFRDQWEAAVAEAYTDELGLASVTPRDSLRGLGGDADVAERIATRVSATTLVRVTGAAVCEGDSVQAVGAYVRGRARRDLCVQRPPGTGVDVPALFYLHSASGNAFAIRTLRDVLPVPLVGVRAAGLHGECDVPRSIGEFADAYLEEIKRAQPGGPYMLCGFSGGGMIAFEVAARLRAEGAAVPLVAMFDAPTPATGPAPDTPDEDELMEGRLRELLRRVENRLRDSADPDDGEVIATLRRGHALTEDMGADVLRRQLLVYARLVRAGWAYEPAYYPGEVDYFAAAAVAAEFELWRPLVERFRPVVLDAEHYEYSIFGNAEFRAVMKERVDDALRCTAR